MPIRVMVAGLGNMGRSHALAYHRHRGFDLVGLVNRSAPKLGSELTGYPVQHDFRTALDTFRPDLVSICTYTNTHADYAVTAIEQGIHVFVEKPLAGTIEEAKRVVAAAKANNRKLVVGYILRHHPSWIRLIAEARKLGGPYVFRMNLNQQSSGASWAIHRRLMETSSPIVDTGVHYVDVMCQITDARAVEVRGMGLRLSAGVSPDMYNYGHFQVLFEDGSLGWFEAAWGPEVSETAFFTKDVMSPRGSVSIITDETGRSDDMATHTAAQTIRVHSADLTPEGDRFVQADELIPIEAEPGLDALCAREQDFVYRAITEDVDLTRHMDDAVSSLRICLAADESVRSGRPVRL